MPENEEQKEPFDISSLRKKLEGKSGKEYWRSLEHLSETEEFQAWTKHEFPQEPSLWDRSTTRRKFLQLMGSMIAMAGLAGCTRQPTEKIVPYVKAPEDLVPGKPLYFATAIPLAGYARGLLVESHMGRPTKVEGNPEHPDSLGAADILSQASVLSLYDPDRSQAVTHRGVISTWDSFVGKMKERLENEKIKKGRGLRILTETVISPTMAHQIENVLRLYPEAKWHQYGPVNRDDARQGALEAFGKDVIPQYRMNDADVVLSLDADFMYLKAGSIPYARAFAKRRRPDKNENKPAKMNRLYSVESTPTLTGARADHRLPLRASDIQSFMIALAEKLGLHVAGNSVHFSEEAQRWIDLVAEDLKRNRGRSLVVAGEGQPAMVHALAHILNDRLGNVGKTLFYTDPVELRSQDQMHSLQELVGDLEKGVVEDLIVLGANPVYKTPSDVNFAHSFKKAAFRVHLGLYSDETAYLSHWHIPESHYLESWSDARAYDGTASIVQPLIQPLYTSRTAHEVLAVLEDRAGRTSYELVREYWKEKSDSLDFNREWEVWLHDGVVKGTRFSERQVSVKPEISLKGERIPHVPGELEAIFRVDPTIGDGDYGNNGWLQELPKPLTRLTWENAALLGPYTAEKYRLSNGDVVELEMRGQKLEVPVWILPGHAKESLTLHLGYGRERSGRLANGVGFNAFKLQSHKRSSFDTGVRLRKTSKKHLLVSTQDHHSMMDRHLVRTADLDQYLHEPDFAQHMTHDPKPNETLYKPEEHLKGEYQWGMTIDLNACIGCGACTVACQSENNIPIVGKEEVANGREMQWIRVDRYFQGDLDQPDMFHQPVPCMHCENAPCEPVCPVGATTHSAEGLNDMTYNRCVGTRYCSNNCPYKVRRFNFYHYADEKIATLKMQKNPDVSVRSRGIMEKCTYCVQRINKAHIDSKKEDRKIRDGEVVTACQQTCPTQAIVFGDVSDPKTRVSQEKADSLNYGILADLGTRPRTTYLAQLRNPNPELAKFYDRKDKTQTATANHHG